MAMQDAPDLAMLKSAIDNTLMDVKPSLIVVDTLARSFAGSGADENSATDMGYLSGHVTCCVNIITVLS